IGDQLQRRARLARTLCRGPRLGDGIAGLALQAKTISLKVHQANFGRARLAVITMAFTQYQETIAVGFGLDTCAAGGHDAVPFGAGFASEYGAQLITGLSGFFSKKDAFAAVGLGKLAGRDFREVRTLFESLAIFRNLAIRPRRGA